MTIWQAILLGIIEGVTEFLPISSTAHLLLAQDLLRVPATAFAKTFAVVVQLGAISAVCLLYASRLVRDWRTNALVIAAFVPTAIVGLFLYDVIKAYLFEDQRIILAALFVGGIVLIAFEHLRPRRDDVAEERPLTVWQAVLVGCFQTLAVVPGVSRAAATIIGGELIGVRRKTIVEFSFLLAIPTMLGASVLDLSKTGASFTRDEWLALSVGFVTAAVAAWFTIRWLVRFIQTHSWTGFGIYRMALAVAFWAML